MSTKLQPTHFSIDFAIRPNVLAFPKLVLPTSDEVQARPTISLDSNENSAGSCLVPRTTLPKSEQSVINLRNLNRYPSASQKALKQCVMQWRKLESIEHLCLGSGASDILDLIIRATCTPSRDKILIAPPTFELYRVCAMFHDVGVQECGQELTPEGDFRLPIEEICAALLSDGRIKVVFLASPGNPTGTLIPLAEIQRILDLEAFQGIVVVDEAYIDFAAFSERVSALNLLSRYNNLIVVQSLSKSHGLAGIRIGMAIAHPIIADILAKLQIPYKISSMTLDLACRALSPKRRRHVRQLQCEVMANRTALLAALTQPPLIQGGVGRPLGGNSANFVVIPIFAHGSLDQPDDGRAMRIVERLRGAHGIAVRYIGRQANCKGCLRITVGTIREIKALARALEQVVNEC